MKYYISAESHAIYMIEDDALMYAPMEDNVFSPESAEWDFVDVFGTKNEPLGDPEYFANHPEKKWRTLGDVYAEVRKALA